MKHFFLTIYFYAPSYPPFDFFLFLFLFNAKRHSKAKNFKSLRNPPFLQGHWWLLCYSVFLPYTSTFDAQSQERKQTREKLVKKKRKKEKSYWRFTVSLCFFFFENIYSYSGMRRIRWFLRVLLKESVIYLFILFCFSLNLITPFSPLYSFLLLMKVKKEVLFCLLF